MTALHVASGRLFGGIEQMLLTIARCRRVTPEIDVAFAVAAPGRLHDELRAERVEVCDLGDVRLSHPATVVRARARFARRIDRAAPSAVICHAPWSFALFAPVARRRGVPVVLWQHDHASGSTFVERWARRTRADLVVCNSQWTSRTVAALQPGVPVVVIPPPVTIPRYAPEARAEIRRELSADGSEVVILSASRFEPWKGHQNLLRALGRISGTPSWTLWIAGAAQRPHERAYAEKLLRDVAQLGIASRVHFLGERRDVPRLLLGADLYCQMNAGPEPFGIVFAEALLSGVPVIAADLGGVPEIVSDACGRLLPPGDLAALAETLQTLIAHPEMRAELAAAGPSHASARCAPEVVLPQLGRALAGLRASVAA
jgi:glycosyltransferase involved in cell wall biosynthesis